MLVNPKQYHQNCRMSHILKSPDGDFHICNSNSTHIDKNLLIIDGNIYLSNNKNIDNY